MLRFPARRVRGRAEFRANGRRGAGEVLLRDRRCRRLTRLGGRLERRRSRGGGRAWDILAEGVATGVSSCRGHRFHQLFMLESYGSERRNTVGRKPRAKVDLRVMKR